MKKLYLTIKQLSEVNKSSKMKITMTLIWFKEKIKIVLTNGKCVRLSPWLRILDKDKNVNL